MANYVNFKRITGDEFDDRSLPQSKAPALATFGGTQWIYNETGLQCGQCASAVSSEQGSAGCQGCCAQAEGKCCLWTVPNKASQVTFELWSGGGSGAGFPAGALCTNAAVTTIGGAGGNYARKTISVQPGWQYTVCAGGSWPCVSVHACTGANGCTSYAYGCNLCNFCVLGGCGGWWCSSDAWGPYIAQTCANNNVCAWFNADFGLAGTVGALFGSSGCVCWGQASFTGAAALIGIRQHALYTEANWYNCGCYINWPAGGGLSAGSTLCNTNENHCYGAGIMGGSGIVKITYA